MGNERQTGQIKTISLTKATWTQRETRSCSTPATPEVDRAVGSNLTPRRLAKTMQRRRTRPRNVPGEKVADPRQPSPGGERGKVGGGPGGRRAEDEEEEEDGWK